MPSAADEHRTIAGIFTERVRGVSATAWERPAPCEGWVARDVVRHLGEVPLDEAVDRFYTADVFMHTWDLARATGQDEALDPRRCAEMLEGMLPMDEALRSSGHYGPRVEVPDDADAQTRLLAFIGRTP
jgi:hypothetical protein